MRNPSRGFPVILLGGFCEVRLLFGQQLLSDALDLLQILMRLRHVTTASRSNRTRPVRDGVIPSRCSLDGREGSSFAPVSKFKSINRGKLRHRVRPRIESHPV